MKSTEEKSAMQRIVSIIEDLRPLLQDRYRAVTPAGFVLVEVLQEIQDIAVAVGGLGQESKDVPVEQAPEEGVTEAVTQVEQDAKTPVTTNGQALRKGSARERHQASIDNGTLVSV